MDTLFRSTVYEFSTCHSFGSLFVVVTLNGCLISSIYINLFHHLRNKKKRQLPLQACPFPASSIRATAQQAMQPNNAVSFVLFFLLSFPWFKPTGPLSGRRANKKKPRRFLSKVKKHFIARKKPFHFYSVFLVRFF